MNLPRSLAVALIFSQVISVSAQTTDPKLLARVSEATLTRAQRDSGDAIWKAKATPMMGNPKVDANSSEEISHLVGDFHWSPDDASSVALTLFENGEWRRTMKEFGAPGEPEAGRWIVKRDHLELWHKGLAPDRGQQRIARCPIS